MNDAIDLEVLIAEKGTTVKLDDDQWYEFDPTTYILRLACCDCGLVHNVEIEPLIDFNLKEKLRIRFTINEEATHIIREKQETWIQKNTVKGWKIVKKKENNNAD